MNRFNSQKFHNLKRFVLFGERDYFIDINSYTKTVLNTQPKKINITNNTGVIIYLEYPGCRGNTGSHWLQSYNWNTSVDSRTGSGYKGYGRLTPVCLFEVLKSFQTIPDSFGGNSMDPRNQNSSHSTGTVIEHLSVGYDLQK